MASLSERDEKRAARGLPTMEQMRIWRSYVETAEIIRSRLGKGQFQSESGILGRLLHHGHAQRRTRLAPAPVRTRRADRMGP